MIARSIVGAIQTCWRDRKSTRLNSSHGYISYAVFCLKKKKNNELWQQRGQHAVLPLSRDPRTIQAYHIILTLQRASNLLPSRAVRPPTRSRAYASLQL